ncbi:ATP-dependent helicase HrpB [Aquisediminimonas sediminicola]|uniref:ATP-dependent helicase HrpB n=1 Tax=Alteraquisediminimonas sediminicola TaxID=2676787 RepID=UPI001C8E9EE6|nr:ATP-dependent helicase HrpB [Aquisediminimonas sediminicola]
MNPPVALPIDDVLPRLLDALRTQSNAVLIGPPGAGKTTKVAPALLDEPWVAGRQILLLSPRRLAARAAAERIAELVGSPLGELVGYATRMDSRQSRQTRLLVVTQGIFRNRIQSEPDLPDVAAVLFDEVHERTLEGDFGLALALDAQAGLRPDLRLLAMSATLDGARFSRLMEGAPVIESEGRSYPLTLRHIGRDATKRIEDGMAAAIRAALIEEQGGILAFLPGMGEIERTAERLGNLGPDVILHRLHGSLDPAAQRAAIRPEPQGHRKIVLATAIAETSLTLDGIRVVIDSGLARRARYDRQAGTSHLVTERVSQAAAIQRAGRAARQGPGVAVRLWEEAATRGLAPYDPPEILESDLGALLLDCTIWGVRDPTSLPWLDPPPAPSLTEARKHLIWLGALDEQGAVTAHGKAMAALPLPPRLAHMLILAGAHGWQKIAGDMAMLLSEHGLGGTDPDLETRWRQWQRDRGKKADSARAMAAGWARRIAGKPAASGDDPAYVMAACVALAFPDRVAKARNKDGSDWIASGGRGYRLDPVSPLARQQFLAVADAQGSAGGAMIRSAITLPPELLDDLFGDRIEQQRNLRFDVASGSAQARLEKKLGAIRLTSGPDSSPDKDAMTRCLVDGVRAHGLDLLPMGKAAERLRQRAAYAGLEALSEDGLIATLDEWLAPLLAGKSRLGQVDPSALHQALQNLIGWDGMKTIEKLTPDQFLTPAGSHHDIDYDAPGGPTVTLRVQSLFGLSVHPVIGTAHIPLILSLTSPAGRPIQTTRDLPGFWAGSWRDVAKEMRGRYPRHPWPDDPASANATLRTKRAGGG